MLITKYNKGDIKIDADCYKMHKRILTHKKFTEFLYRFTK